MLLFFIFIHPYSHLSFLSLSLCLCPLPSLSLYFFVVCVFFVSLSLYPFIPLPLFCPTIFASHASLSFPLAVYLSIYLQMLISPSVLLDLHPLYINPSLCFCSISLSPSLSSSLFICFHSPLAVPDPCLKLCTEVPTVAGNSRKQSLPLPLSLSEGFWALGSVPAMAASFVDSSSFPTKVAITGKPGHAPKSSRTSEESLSWLKQPPHIP